MVTGDPREDKEITNEPRLRTLASFAIEVPVVSHQQQQ